MGIALALTLVALSAAPSAAEPAVAAATAGGRLVPLTLTVEGQRSMRGQLLVCITANAGAFPDCRRDPGATRLVVPLSDAGTLRASLATGRNYAVAIIHDENANGRLDKVMGIPREGFGFSRNPAIRMGPPRFNAAAFHLDGPEAEEVRLRYML